MTQNAAHSSTQATVMSAADINQSNVIQPSIITYKNVAANVTNPTNGNTLGWTSISKATSYALSQPFYAPSNLNLSSVRIPISVSGYTNIEAFDSFSSACDITVSMQNADQVFETPTGPVSSTSTITVPANVVQTVDSSNWPEPQSALPGSFSTTTSAYANVPLTAISALLTAPVNTATATTIPVSSTACFFLSGGVGSAQIVGTQATYTISFTGISSTSLTGCTFTASPSGVSEVLPTGTVVVSTLPSSFTYVVAGSFLLAANLTPNSPANNVVYVAPYIDGGAIGQWLAGNPVPEYPCSFAYSPSTFSIFAAGPSGAIYQASLDDLGVMGAWVVVPNNLSLPTFTKAPSLCVATIDSIDYVFVTGGLTSAGSVTSAYCLTLDTNGNVTSTLTLPNLSSPNYLSNGLQSFVANNTVYVRNSSNSVIQLFGLALSIDFATGNLATSSTWYHVNSSGSIGYTLFGQALDNVATDIGLTGLTPNGYGSSDFTNNWPLAFTSSGGVVVAGMGAVFENNDGSASIVFSSGYSNKIYKTTWLNVPVSCTLSNGVLYCLTITASSPLNTNFGVNVATVNDQAFLVTLPVYFSKSSSTASWQSQSSTIPFGIYSGTSASSFPIGLIENSGQSWSYFWFDSPNELLTTVTTVTYDNAMSTSSSSVVALNYDGLGGVVYTNETLTFPVLTDITEIANS